MSYLPLLKHLADEADRIATHYFRSNRLKVSRKENTTPVSVADLEIEKVIRDYVQEHHPELGILGEEYEAVPSTTGSRLIIDPIDGTQNFITNVPFFACLLAVETNGKVVSGLISAPMLHERWWAESGKGAFANGHAVHVSDTKELSQSQINYGSLFGVETEPEHQESVIKLLSQSRRQRGYGDFYSHLLVGCGSADISIEYNVHPWDMAPIKIFVEEAGGRFTDFKGEDTIYSGNFIVSNGHLHSQALAAWDK